MHAVHCQSVSTILKTAQELLVLVKAAVMSACGDCYQPCGPVNKKGEVECVPAQAAAGRLAKAGLTN